MKKLICLLVLLVPGIASAQYRGGYGPNGPPPNYNGDFFAFHNGLTFEGNIGLGGMYARVTDDSGNSATSDTRPSLGADVGIGGFLTRQIALTLRVATVNYSEDANDGAGGTNTLTALFIGPSLQYWVTPQFWLGGGIGYAQQHTSYSDAFGNTADSVGDPTGLGLDLRVGFTFWQQFRNTMNVSFEYTPGFYGKQDGTNLNYQLNGFQVSFGYQFL